jgi:hypothetical protein
MYIYQFKIVQACMLMKYVDGLDTMVCPLVQMADKPLMGRCQC